MCIYIYIYIYSLLNGICFHRKNWQTAVGDCLPICLGWKVAGGGGMYRNISGSDKNQYCRSNIILKKKKKKKKKAISLDYFFF